MAVNCPNYNTPEWTRLTEILGEAGLSRFMQKKSHRMYMRFETSGDPLMTALKQLDPNIVTPSKKYDSLVSSAAKYDENKVDHKYYNKAGEEYTSVSRILDSYEETKYRGQDAGSAFADAGTNVHKIFEDYARGVNVENIRQHAKDNNIPESFVGFAMNFVDDLKKTGIVLVENVLGEDNLKIAGKPDIIHIKFDGTIDIYDFKTAYQTASKRKQNSKIWNPTGDYDGYKSRRYTVQTDTYGRMVERILGQPVSRTYIVPIEVAYTNDDPSAPIESIKMLPSEDTSTYGYVKSSQIVDRIFGEKQQTPTPVLSSIDDSTELIEKLTGVVQYVQENLDEEAERILTLSQFHTVRNGALYYLKNGKPVRLNNQTDRNAQKQQIIDEYLRQKYSSYKDTPNSIMNYLTTGDEKFLQLDRKAGQSMRAILRPYLKKDGVNVVSLSDIKGFESKKNWIAIMQGSNTDLLYVGNEEMEAKFRTLKSSDLLSKGVNKFSETLFANLGIDAATASYELGSNLRNTIVDARRLEAGFIAMKLKEGNPDLTFDRILLHSVNKKSPIPYAVDLRTVIPIIEKMGKHPVTSKSVPKNSLATLSNTKLLDPATYQPDFKKVYMDEFDNLAFARDFSILAGLQNYSEEHLNKENLLFLIQARIQNTLRRAEEDPAALDEARLLSELFYQLKGVSTEIAPISWIDSKVSVPQNVANPVIQDLVKSYGAALSALRENFWNGYKKDFNSKLSGFFRDSGDFFSKTSDKILSQTTRYFEPLFERDTFKVQQPDGTVSTVELNTFSLIKEDSDKFRALAKHQQDMITYLNDKIMASAAKQGITWQRGRLPLVRASFFNKFYRRGEQTSYNELLSKMFENMEENFGFGEKTNQTDTFSIENRFRSQENDENYDGRKNIMGIDSSGFVNMEEYNEWETNLEVVVDLFTMEGLRMEHMNKVAGEFNAAESLFKWQKSALFEERVGMNVNFVQWWREAQLFNRDVDSGSVQSKFVNAANKATSIGLIAAKPSVAFVSFMSQQMTSFSQAIGNSFNGSKDYSIADWAKAGTMVSNPANYKKISLLLQQYGLYNLSMTDLVNGHHREGNKSIFRMKYLYSLLNAGDWFSRSQLLVAQMVHDGTWDAYSVNGEQLVYDESKDGRFNGEKLKPEQGKALKEAIRYQLVRDGQMTQNDTVLTRAYDSNLTGRIKGQANQVIGGFDRDTRGLYSFHSWGKLLGLFKTWLPARLNKGFSSSYTSEVMGNYEFTTTKDGSVMAVWKGEQMEGILNTLMYYGWYLKKYGKSPEKLTTNQKNNLRRAVADVILIASVFLLYSSLPDDDDETKMDDNTAMLIRRSIDDLLSTYNMFTIFDFFYTPVAVTYASKTLDQLWQVMTKGPDISDKTLDNILSKVPVVNTMQEMYNVVDSIEEQ